MKKTGDFNFKPYLRNVIFSMSRKVCLINSVSFFTGEGCFHGGLCNHKKDQWFETNHVTSNLHIPEHVFLGERGFLVFIQYVFSEWKDMFVI